MKRQHGYTLAEMLVTMSLVAILGGTGLYSWQHWQQKQQLRLTASQVRDFLVWLRNDANWHNRTHMLRLQQNADEWCLSAEEEDPICQRESPFALKPLWRGITISDFTPALSFYGLRNTAWGGHIRLRNQAGEWVVIVSNWGRIRLCDKSTNIPC